MLVAAGIALWRGWKIHTGFYAWSAYGLGRRRWHWRCGI
jgi:hypothetical protein